MYIIVPKINTLELSYNYGPYHCLSHSAKLVPTHIIILCTCIIIYFLYQIQLYDAYHLYAQMTNQTGGHCCNSLLYSVMCTAT